MPRKPSTGPNDVELAILRVVWDRGAVSVRDVHESLGRARDTGYTSTLKMMQVMLEKGLLKRDGSKRPQVYRAAIPEEITQNRILSNLIQKVFGGSARKLVLRAVRSQRISAGELAEIRKLLGELEGDAK
jgi:predicted transcriptional regulator